MGEFDESKTHLFLIHFSDLYSNLIANLYVEIWKPYQIYIL